ncbi:MAG: FecR domain-containing protein [Chloroflexota bacterium]|nr:FecR domain-containing protein [Chloroflexota bacterium]
MRSKPERVAWVVLLLSFLTCIGLTVAVPLGIRHYILYARVGQKVTLEVQQPPLSVTLAGRGLPISVAERHDDIPEQTIVATAATAGQLVMHAPQPDSPIVATVQLYDHTEVTLSSTQSPRFAASRLPHQVVLEMEAGRARISVSDDNGRSTTVEVHTPHGTVTLAEGTYWVSVNAMTEITVRDGRASASNSAGQSVSLGAAERAIIRSSDQIVGPLSAARNLITNSDFTAPLYEGWVSYSKDIQFEGEPGGKVERTEVEGRPVIIIEREGEGHAETGITQQLDVDIRDFSFLQLHVLLYIEEHNVPVCGSLGSECPVMVRIDYKDANGGNQQWLQGFYSRPDPNPDGNPLFCVTCSTHNEHIKVPEDTWHPYDSDNLIPLLSQDGKTPILINSITVNSSGHMYKALIAEVELIGQE